MLEKPLDSALDCSARSPEPESACPPSPRVRPQSLRIGAVTLASRFTLAPLAGYTNLPFRLLIREIGGVGLCTTDLVNAKALLKRSVKSLELIQTSREDQPLAIQLYGADGGEIRAAAQWLEAQNQCQLIDINMGCPVHKVVKCGSGSAMMCNPPAALTLVRQVVEGVRLPVTVKMRLGWDSATLSAPYFARAFEQIGVAAITIHGRTRAQGFSGQVDLEGIRQTVAAVERIPVLGNGDVRSLADAERMFAATGCAGIAIGRGALLNPWFFAQLTHHETTGEILPAPSYQQRLDFMAKHFHMQVAQRGERLGCLTFRKMAGWYSKVLKPGRVLHQRLMMVSSSADFAEVFEMLRAKGPPPRWSAEAVLAVPAGPNERW